MPSRFVDSKIAAAFKTNGVHHLFPWQVEALASLYARNPHKNFVYSAPTSGGKSLIADLIVWQALVEDPSSWALLIFPFVALVKEKEASLRKIGRLLKKTVVSFYFGSPKPIEAYDVAVATVEKAATLLQRTKPGDGRRLAIVVFDEFHILFSPGRGELLENSNLVEPGFHLHLFSYNKVAITRPKRTKANSTHCRAP